MKHFYYSESDQQLGPFTIEEIKTKRLKKSTLVWTDGLEDWVTADKIDELKDLLVSEPPPLPKFKKEDITTKNETQKVENSIYDLTYEKETTATNVGLILLVFYIVVFFVIQSIDFGYVSDESYNKAKAVFGAIELISRIIFTIWVVNIAKRQNRNSVGWGFLGFFFPLIALIIIGLLRKLRNEEKFIILEQAVSNKDENIELNSNIPFENEIYHSYNNLI